MTRISALLRRTSDLVIAVDFDGRILEINPSACEYWQVEEYGMKSASILALLSLESALKFSDFLQNVKARSSFHNIRSGVVFSESLILVQKDGQESECQLSAAIESDCLLVLCSEVRHQKSKMNQEFLETLQIIASNIPCVIYQFKREPSGQFSFPFLSPGIEDLMEGPLEWLGHDGMELFEMVQESSREQVARATEESTRSLTPFVLEIQMTTYMGREKWVKLQSTPRLIEDGSIIWDGFITDITTEVLLREQQKLNERQILEQQAQIESSRRLAALGEMAGGIAHEINNPLAIIDGYALQIRELIEENGNASDAGLTHAASKIQSTIRRISRIITGLRAMSRESEDDPFVVATLSTIVDDTLALCAQTLRHKGIEINVPAGLETFEIECRPVQISQVLLNLIVNAQHAVERGSREKWIKIEARDMGTAVELSVTDSGDGIPSEIRSKIFEPFFTTKSTGHGTGLGLSISYGIIRGHGGQIFVDPAVENTCFKIIIAKRQKSGQALAPSA